MNKNDLTILNLSVKYLEDAYMHIITSRCLLEYKNLDYWGDDKEVIDKLNNILVDVDNITNRLALSRRTIEDANKKRE